MAERDRPERVFLVGFPRSGTTLLQALLGTHPRIATFPETFFFVDLVPARRRRRLLGLAGPGAGERLREAARCTDGGNSRARARAPWPPTMRRFALRFCSLLDEAAAGEGALAWVEKTPSHLHRVETIEDLVPDAKFIHIVRAGEAAVASLFAVTQEHPEHWGGERSLERCIRRWQADVRRSAEWAGRENHAFVSYEELVAATGPVLSDLLAWLGLPAGEEVATMLRDYAGTASRVADGEPWKQGAGAAIANRNDARLAAVLSPGERDELSLRLAPERRLASDLPFLGGVAR
jgi:hypothetical protein